MASKHFPSLAAAAFAAMLFHFFLKRRSREINRREANNDAAANEGTAGGPSGANPPTGVPEMSTSSGPAKDAAANDGTAGGDSGAHTSTGIPEMATPSGPAKDAAANDGTAGGASDAHTPTGVPEMATTLGPAKDAAANDGTARGPSGAHTPTGVPEMATSSGPAKDAAANDGTEGGASGVHTSTEGDGMGTSSGYDYEVFLSFRGPDTRATFTDHLYTRLKDLGIHAFKDDECLRKGEEFGPELLQAIKQSKILVPIFSKDYATSVWCLKEVVQMVECWKTGGQKIMPIFYDVAPAEVRRQTEGYGDALLSHENKKRYAQKTIHEWKDALTAVAGMNGYDLQSMPNRREGEFVKTFAHKIFNELKKASLAVSDYFVRVDNHVDAIMEKIGAETSETRIIGIHGMGGIGKTTIAGIIFNKFAYDFEDHCFLRDIRETSKTSGIHCLQMQLISSILKEECTDIKDVHEGTRTIKNRLSNKRVLLLLDDVEEADHIDALVCKRDWLGKGSKIIITSRRIDVLYVPEVDWRYELTGMDLNQSLQLFSKHAFRRDSPLYEYINQSNRAIKIAGGLPLAIEVIGSLLSRTEKEKWDRILNKLADVPAAEVRRRLKISYDALEAREKHIFLDIACLFIGHDKDILVRFWESKFFPEDAIEVLQNMSLIKINEDNKVWMHDHLRDLGREEVREKSDMEEEKQSRVWDPKIGLDLLMKHKEKKEVQALRLKLEYQSSYRFTYKGFENLSNLRFLEVDGLTENFHVEERLLWHESPSNVFPTNENSNLLPHLRWLSWSYFPQTFNVANFSMEDLVILDLSKSKITYDWKGWSHMKVMKNLKVLNLSGCQNLRRLPDELGRYLASLECLSLNHCLFLERLPDSIGDLESLIELDISGTMIEELPDSIGRLRNLKRLKMMSSAIRKMPDALWTIEKLEEIKVSIHKYHRSFHVNIGNCIYKSQSLRILKLERAEIYSLPRLPESLITLELHALKMDTFPNLSNLTNLEKLKLRFEPRDSFDEESNGPLEEYPMPQWIGNLSNPEYLNLSCHSVTTSPTDLSLPPQLKKFVLDCPKLRRLQSLDLSSRDSRESLLKLPDLSNLKNLYSLEIRGVAIEEIQGLRCLEKLQDLQLFSLGQLKILPDLSNLNELRTLLVEECDNLVEIQGALPRFLDKLHISSCDSLRNLPDLSNLKNLYSLEIRGAAIEEIQGLGCLENLPDLKLFSLKQVKILPDLSNLNKLWRLHVFKCDNLVEIQGTIPRFLKKLHISSCDSLLKLPDLSNLKNLYSLEIRGIAIEEIQGLGCLENLQGLKLFSLKQVKILPDLSNLNKLWSLDVFECDNLVEIQGKLPRSLNKLHISSCDSLLKLPDLSNKILSSLKIRGAAIEEIQGLGRLKNLRDLQLRSLGQVKILPDLSNLNRLRCLHVSECDNLVEIQGELPQSLDKLHISSCNSLQNLPDQLSLMGMKKVEIEHCNKLNEEAILRFARVIPQDLRLRYFGRLQILPDLSNSSELESLRVRGCHNLVEIQGELPQSLRELDIHCCESLLKLHDLSNLKNLYSLDIHRAAIEEIQGLGCLENLWDLQLCSLGQVKILPDLSNLNKLKCLHVSECDNLVEIQGLCCLENLGDLQLRSLGQLKLLPDLSNLNKLRSLDVFECDNLVEIQGELPQSLVALEISSCDSLQKLPDLSSLKELRSVKIEDCRELKGGGNFRFCLEKSGEFAGGPTMFADLWP